MAVFAFWQKEGERGREAGKDTQQWAIQVPKWKCANWVSRHSHKAWRQVALIRLVVVHVFTIQVTFGEIETIGIRCCWHNCFCRNLFGIQHMNSYPDLNHDNGKQLGRNRTLVGTTGMEWRATSMAMPLPCGIPVCHPLSFSPTLVSQVIKLELADNRVRGILPSTLGRSLS